MGSGDHLPLVNSSSGRSGAAQMACQSALPRGIGMEYRMKRVATSGTVLPPTPTEQEAICRRSDTRFTLYFMSHNITLHHRAGTHANQVG